MRGPTSSSEGAKRFLNRVNKVGRCLLDAFQAKKHKCCKAKFDPKHNNNQKFMKGKSSQAAEQLWPMMEWRSLQEALIAFRLGATTENAGEYCP